jgi:hypothetical protein
MPRWTSTLIFDWLTAENKPRDPERNGAGLIFSTHEHDEMTMPTMIELRDRRGRWCRYMPRRPPPPLERPQDGSMDGAGLRFDTLDHDDDAMPERIRVTDPEGRCAVYEPMNVDGRPIQSHGYDNRLEE